MLESSYDSSDEGENLNANRNNNFNGPIFELLNPIIG
jgi:hypothetical protein